MDTVGSGLVDDGLVTLSGSGLSKDGLIWESDVVEVNSLDGGEGEGG